MRFAATSSLIATGYLAVRTHALPRPVASYSVVNVNGGPTSSSLPTTVYQTVTESSNPETTTLVETSSITENSPDRVPTTSIVISTDYTATWTGTPDRQPTTTNTVLIPEASPAATKSESSTSAYTTSSSFAYSNFPDLVATTSTSVFTPGYTTVTAVSTAESSAATPSTSSFAYSNFPDLVATTSLPAPTETTVTVVSTAVPTTTSYYDNGMWHTSYAVKEDAYATPTSQYSHGVSDIGYTYAATGTGANNYRRAWGTGTGVGLAARAAATGYHVVSWNETSDRW